MKKVIPYSNELVTLVVFNSLESSAADALQFVNLLGASVFFFVLKEDTFEA